MKSLSLQISTDGFDKRIRKTGVERKMQNQIEIGVLIGKKQIDLLVTVAHLETSWDDWPITRGK